MAIVIGLRTFGRVDSTEEGLRVVTRFFHVCYVPLVPLASFVLLPESDAGLPIPMSGKSVLFAYLRGGLAVATFLSVIDALTSHGDSARAFLFVALFAAIFAASYPLSRASKARREELLRLLTVE